MIPTAEAEVDDWAKCPTDRHSHLTRLPSSVSLQICPSIQFLASEICVIRIGGSVAERPMIPV